MCAWYPSFRVYAMFEKWSKKAAIKATDSAVEGVKESLNDKLDQYSGIIKIGLVLGVIVLGGKQLIKSDEKRYGYRQETPMLHLPSGISGQPIVINNYYKEFGPEMGRASYKEFRPEMGRVSYKECGNENGHISDDFGGVMKNGGQPRGSNCGGTAWRQQKTGRNYPKR